jgi:hypothetical protein
MKSYLLALLLIATSVRADSPFDGTWIWDTDSTQLSTRPDVYLLDTGVYRCESCIPALRVPADAREHSVAGQPNYDAVTVTTLDAAVVKVVMTQSHKLVSVHTLTVAQDGQQLTHQSEDHSTATPIVQRVQAERVAHGPAGSHPISGSWRQTKLESVSESGTTVTLKVSAEGISFKDPSGVGYEAKFDGKDYPMVGVSRDTRVSVRLIDERTFEETAKHDGKVESVIRLTVAADGKTAEYVYDDRRQGTVTRGKLHKKLSAAAVAAADLSGVWMRYPDPYVGGADYPPMPGGPPPLKEPYATSWKTFLQKRDEAAKRGEAPLDASARCLPEGMPTLMAGTYALEILQGNDKVVVLGEFLSQTRRIFLHAPMPPLEDISPSYNGFSTGRWEGDTLVVQTAGVSEEVIFMSMPHSTKMRITERIRRVSRDMLENRITIDDSEVFTKPYEFTFGYKRDPGYQIGEYICDNNRYTAGPDGNAILQVK